MINFETFHFAENLLYMSYEQLFDSINAQNTTLSLELFSKQSSPPIKGDNTLEISFKMLVPQQQRLLVKVPIIETFKLAYMQYVSFLILCYLILYKLILGCAYEKNIMNTNAVSEILSVDGVKLKKNWF